VHANQPQVWAAAYWAKAMMLSMAAYLDILSIAKNLERIADHATNIVEDVVYLSTGEIVRHQQR